MRVLQRLWRYQWPFWLGGVFVGLAETLYYVRYHNIISVTTGLAMMFSNLETQVLHTTWLSRVYHPGVHPIIIGTLVGSFLVGIAERERRSWVHYNKRMLLLSFVGGFVFSFGTRLAAGCTTQHFLGGIPAMNVGSWGVLLTSIPAAFVVFRLQTRLGLARYLRHQETRAVAISLTGMGSDPKELGGYDPAYRPARDPLRWVLLAFFLGVVGLAVYAGLTRPIWGGVAVFGWSNVLYMFGIGILMGWGLAKTGFGTECSVMCPEALAISDARYDAMGVARGTREMFKGMLPLTGFLVALALFSSVIWGGWVFFGIPIPNVTEGAPGGLYWGHLLGGPLLGAGAVLMIGCEIRTYARLGLGYMTALAALPGFYLGYVPYTLYYHAINRVIFGHYLIKAYTIPQLLAQPFGDPLWLQQALGLLYVLALWACTGWSFRRARIQFQLPRVTDIIRTSTDDLLLAAVARQHPSRSVAETR